MRGGNWKDKAIKGLAWASFVLAIASGAAITATFIGGWVSGAVGFLPNWVAIVLLVAGVIAIAVDLFVDGVPNKLAVSTSIVMPSVAAAVDGKLAASVTDLSHSMLSRVEANFGPWLGQTSALGLAAAMVVASMLIARRTVQQGR